MFGTVNTGDGESGPFLGYSPKGSVDKGLGKRSWTIRAKDGDRWAYSPTTAMDDGVMLDLWMQAGAIAGSLKLGWQEDTGGVKGVVPTRVWAPSPTQPIPRPDDRKSATGKFLWSPTFSVRCATKGGDVLVFEGGSFAVYDAFSKVLNGDIAAAIAGNEGMCPIIRVTGYRDEVFKGGSTSIPTLNVVAWKPRHPALKADAPTFAAQPYAQPAPAQPAALPESVAADDFGDDWK